MVFATNLNQRRADKYVGPDATAGSGVVGENDDGDDVVKGHHSPQPPRDTSGHHCLVPLFVLFLIFSVLLLQVSKVERLHKVSVVEGMHVCQESWHL